MSHKSALCKPASGHRPAHGFPATVDFPGCVFWRELSEFYPEAKVLLSVRDPEKWFESTQATIFSKESEQRLGQTPMRPFFEKTVWRVFGDRIHDKDFMIDVFNRHNAEVQRVIPANRLLVFEAARLGAALSIPRRSYS